MMDDYKEAQAIANKERKELLQKVSKTGIQVITVDDLINVSILLKLNSYDMDILKEACYL